MDYDAIWIHTERWLFPLVSAGSQMPEHCMLLAGNVKNLIKLLQKRAITTAEVVLHKRSCHFHRQGRSLNIDKQINPAPHNPCLLFRRGSDWHLMPEKVKPHNYQTSHNSHVFVCWKWPNIWANRKKAPLFRHLKSRSRFPSETPFSARNF